MLVMWYLADKALGLRVNDDKSSPPGITFCFGNQFNEQHGQPEN